MARRALTLGLTFGIAACAQRPRPSAPIERGTDDSGVRAEAAHACDPASGPVALELVSWNAEGELARACREGRPACKNASHPKLSADGSRVAFDSDAPLMTSELATLDVKPQIYLRDLEQGVTMLASGRRIEGVLTPADAPCAFAELSGDGRWVVYASSATNLVDGDEAGFEDVFAFDTQAQRTVRVSQNFDGAEFDAGSFDPVVSHDGRFIAFASSARNLAPLVGVGGEGVVLPAAERTRIFLADRQTRRFEWIDRHPDGDDGEGSSQTQISADGDVIVFTSSSNTLAGEDGNDGQLDVFACLRAERRIVRVSVAHGSTRGANGVNRKPRISGNGRFVLFEGDSTDITPPGVDTNNQSDVFVRDLRLGVTTRVSVSSSGGQAAGTSGYGALSYDGRYVAFSSTARNLVPNDTSRGFLDFFVQDRDVSGNGVLDEPGDICTRRMSITPEGVQANARSGGNCALSADGRFAVFMSESNLLHPGDDNGFDEKLKCSPTCLFGRDVFRARVY